MSAPQFHPLRIQRLISEAAGAVAITLAVPPELHAAYAFKPGQFLTLRARIGGQQVRRSYSICSSTQRFAQAAELTVGIKPVAGGLFSNWAVQLKADTLLDVMTPEGRFTPRAGLTAATSPHRVGFAAGSGITPVLSIIASTLHADPQSRFTLVYANQRVGSIMFNEALQDLKDQYPARLTLIHILSRQAQDVALLGGRLDAPKVAALLAALLPVAQIDEAFICGPEGMMDATEQALRAAGLPPERVHSERFFAADAAPVQAVEAQPATLMASPNAIKNISNYPIKTGAIALNDAQGALQTSLQVVLDGKTHSLTVGAQDKLLDVALAAGLDLPYACRGGVCCTCRARVLKGQVVMEKNFTLETWEVDKGFVLTCQARALTPEVVVSFDER